MPPPWSCRNPARLRREEIPRLLVRFHFPIKFALDLMSMPFVVIIPARLASTRLPNKPLADLGGKPMIVRVAERAAQSGAARIIAVRAMYFTRAPIPWHRDGFAQSIEAFPARYAPLLHIGLYAYTNSFL